MNTARIRTCEKGAKGALVTLAVGASFMCIYNGVNAYYRYSEFKRVLPLVEIEGRFGEVKRLDEKAALMKNCSDYLASASNGRGLEGSEVFDALGNAYVKAKKAEKRGMAERSTELETKADLGAFAALRIMKQMSEMFKDQCKYAVIAALANMGAVLALVVVVYSQFNGPLPGPILPESGKNRSLPTLDHNDPI